MAAMSVDVCRGCGADVWESNVTLARALVSSRQQRGYRVIHCWWTGDEWMSCVLEAGMEPREAITDLQKIVSLKELRDG